MPVRSVAIGPTMLSGISSCMDVGESMVTCSEDDETIYVYNCRSGLYVFFYLFIYFLDLNVTSTIATRETKKLFSRKYGIQLAKFTHAANCILHTSTKEDFTIRYLSLHDNKYMRYFRGHQGLYVLSCPAYAMLL